MYFFNKSFEGSPWGLQGDAHLRQWDIGTDLEQLLLRGGVTYRPPSTNVLITLGYANITNGQFGSSEKGPHENRTYLEVLLPQRVATRFYLRHRFRFEQRWVEGQDSRTRYRYNFFVDVPLNREDLGRGAVYLAFYNEIFINGERQIGSGRQVDYFDRNRLYAGLGYSFADRMRVQLAYMRQTTSAWSKGQLQLSLHHSF
jgi:hypothetical protein